MISFVPAAARMYESDVFASGLKASANGKNRGVTVIVWRRLAVRDWSEDEVLRVQILMIESADPDAKIPELATTAIQLIEFS
jgi:hypothetical protein